MTMPIYNLPQFGKIPGDAPKTETFVNVDGVFMSEFDAELARKAQRIFADKKQDQT